MMFWAEVREFFGEDGPAGLKILLNSIRDFFQAIPPEGASTKFVFTYRLREGDVDETQYDGQRVGAELSVESLSGHRKRISAASSILIAVRTDGRYDVVDLHTCPPLEMLSERSLVFVNECGVDRFIIGGRSKPMPAFLPGAASNFAEATESDLQEALERYRANAAEVACPILKCIWVGGRNGHRLVFRNKPEARMRRSLEWFLNASMRNVSVRPEHNTDESKPVDIVVDWFGSRLRALIEIKWLGDSLTKDSDGARFTSYRDSRAQEGADQLADYLDREQSTDAGAALKGYLVVFDGRRRNVTHATTPIAAFDALYYRDRDIVLSRDHLRDRADMQPLIRYYLEPRASLFAQPDATGRTSLRESG